MFSSLIVALLSGAVAGQELDLTATGFEYTSSNCATSAEALGKTAGGNAWDCVAFDTRVPIMANGSTHPRGFSFKIPCPDTSIHIGIQWAGTRAVTGQPDTWDTSSTANFKRMYDDVIGSCSTNSCGGFVDVNGFDAGMRVHRRANMNTNVHASYNNKETMFQLYSETDLLGSDTVFSILLENNKIKWYVGGVQKHEITGIQGHRSNKPMYEKFWVVAAVYYEKALPTCSAQISEITYLENIAQPWVHTSTSSTTSMTTATLTTTSTETQTATHPRDPVFVGMARPVQNVLCVLLFVMGLY